MDAAVTRTPRDVTVTRTWITAALSYGGASVLRQRFKAFVADLDGLPRLLPPHVSCLPPPLPAAAKTLFRPQSRGWPGVTASLARHHAAAPLRPQIFLFVGPVHGLSFGILLSFGQGLAADLRGVSRLPPTAGRELLAVAVTVFFLLSPDVLSSGPCVLSITLADAQVISKFGVINLLSFAACCWCFLLFSPILNSVLDSRSRPPRSVVLRIKHLGRKTLNLESKIA